VDGESQEFDCLAGLWKLRTLKLYSTR